MRLHGLTSGLAGALLLACAAEPEGPSFGTDPGGTTEDGEASTVGSESGGAEESSTGAEEGTLFDVPAGDEETGGPEDGCRKVDFVFVVDNSPSMLDEQAALIASFPGFMEAIEDTLKVQDFHVLVIDTDGAPKDCELFCSGNSLWCGNASCAGLPEPGTCEATLGAGRTEDLMGDPCPIDGDRRYLATGQVDLPGTFACMATIGGGNAQETQADALIAALGGEHNGPGGCHDGFLRDDAILVVTLISDEGDHYSGGNAQIWKDAVVAAKGGDEEAIVFLGVLPDGDIGGVCEELTPAAELRAFADSFAHGQWQSICVDSYVDYFLGAVGTIDLACDEFDPEG